MKEKGLPVQGFIVNHYTGSPMEKDNIRMIEKLSGKPVLAVVATTPNFYRPMPRL